MATKKSDFDKVLSAWDVLVIAFGAMIGWGWVVSTGDWIMEGGVLGAMLGFVIGGIMVFFVGLTYAYHYYKDHHIQPYTPSLPLATDTVTIKHNLHLEQVAATLGIPMELLQALNPQYKQDIIPAAVRTYPLVLPQREISRFLEQEQAIYDKDSIYLADHLSTAGESKQPVPAVAQTTSYKVRKGDTLGAIAAKHGVTAAQLMKWNGLKSANRLQIGQTLKITRP